MTPPFPSGGQADRVPVFIGLGSNVGDSLGFLQRATDRLAEVVALDKASRIVRSAPMYEANQPDFLNAVLGGHTRKDPRRLIASFKEIEDAMGREKRYRNGPREIDIDLIIYGSLRYRFGELIQVPHPRMGERRFVLQPLAEIAPDLLVPGFGRVEDMLQATNDQVSLVQTLEDAKLSIPG